MDNPFIYALTVSGEIALREIAAKVNNATYQKTIDQIKNQWNGDYIRRAEVEKAYKFVIENK